MKNSGIVTYPNSVKNLSITAAPLRELLNFLIYRQEPDLLNEEARRQPLLTLAKLPDSIKQLSEMLRAEKCEKGRKLHFDCTRTEKLRSVLVHNIDAQFWVFYFHCGIGLVDVSHFSRVPTGKVNFLPSVVWEVTNSYEYQWFSHNLDDCYFKSGKSKSDIKRLAKYFIECVNPNLVSPYSIRAEEKITDERYKFVKGSLNQLRKVVKCALVVCESIKRRRFPNEKCWVSPYLTLVCGNLKFLPALLHPTEPFVTQVCQLVIKENIAYTVLGGSNYWRMGNHQFDWVKREKHQIYLNFQEEIMVLVPREKLVARTFLINWLKRQGSEGERILKTWRLE